MKPETYSFLIHPTIHLGNQPQVIYPSKTQPSISTPISKLRSKCKGVIGKAS